MKLAFWLPFFSLWIWVILVVLPIAQVYFNLMVAAAGSGAAHLGGMVIPRSQFFTMALHFGSNANAGLVKALELPGMFGEVAVSLCLTWPDSWRPSGLMLDDWRVLSFPIFCIPCWWFAGLGLEGYLQLRKLRWLSIVPGSILCIFYSVLFVGLGFEEIASKSSESSEITWTFWGLGLWSLLMAIFPITLFRDRRSRRRG